MSSKLQNKKPCIVFVNDEDFAYTKKKLESKISSFKWELSKEGLGFQFYSSPEASLPDALLILDKSIAVTPLLKSVEADFSPAYYIICKRVEVAPDYPLDSAVVMLPAVCLRAVSKPEIDRSFVLYEEMLFDENLQNEFRAQLPLDWPESKVSRMFSSLYLDSSPAGRNWIFRKLRAPVADRFSGEFLKAAESFGVRVASILFLKVDSSVLEKIPAYWGAVFRSSSESVSS